MMTRNLILLLLAIFVAYPSIGAHYSPVSELTLDEVEFLGSGNNFPEEMKLRRVKVSDISFFNVDAMYSFFKAYEKGINLHREPAGFVFGPASFSISPKLFRLAKKDLGRAVAAKKVMIKFFYVDDYIENEIERLRQILPNASITLDKNIMTLTIVLDGLHEFEVYKDKGFMLSRLERLVE